MDPQAERPAFTLTGAQQQRKAEVSALAREVLVPLARAGQPGRVNRKLVRALGDHGLIARLVSRDASASALELCLLREALAQECPEAETALDAAVAHAASRQTFGRPLREFQAISHPLAEMATRTEAARLLVYAAASRYDAGAGGVTQLAAMAKLYATETAQWVVDAAVQIHGARALVRGHLLERLYREVRAPRIYEGTSEIQRTVIARELFQHPGQPKGNPA
jgi:alkylation response protein AidB-like acyl-CoA dehydrogenase